MNKGLIYAVLLMGVACSFHQSQAKSCCAYKTDQILQNVINTGMDVTYIKNNCCNGGGGGSCSCERSSIPGTVPTFSGNTITAAGSYCLSGDHTGTITIDTSNVTLDLNGYRIGGIALGESGDPSNIVIKNGIVVGTITTPVSALTVTNVSLDGLAVTGQSTFDCTIDGIFIQNCLFRDMVTISAANMPARNISIIDCSFVAGGGALGNNGLNIPVAAVVSIKGCLAEGFPDEGFLLGVDGQTAVVELDMQECVAKNNGIGFRVLANAGAGINSRGVIKQCIAEYNSPGVVGGFGFDIALSPTLPMHIVSCYAKGNGTNPAGSSNPDPDNDTNYASNGTASNLPGESPFWQQTNQNTSGIAYWANISEA